SSTAGRFTPPVATAPSRRSTRSSSRSARPTILPRRARARRRCPSCCFRRCKRAVGQVFEPASAFERRNQQTGWQVKKPAPPPSFLFARRLLFGDHRAGFVDAHFGAFHAFQLRYAQIELTRLPGTGPRVLGCFQSADNVARVAMLLDHNQSARTARGV